MLDINKNTKMNINLNYGLKIIEKIYMNYILM